VSRELIQTAANGFTRTFSMFRDYKDVAWLSIEIRNRDGQMVDTDCMTFTTAELAQFQQLVAQA
jgi:hypothetical protein